MGKIFFLPLAFLTCNVILQCTPGWWNGRHKGLKIPRFIRAGSSPAPGTTIVSLSTEHPVFFFFFTVPNKG